MVVGGSLPSRSQGGLAFAWTSSTSMRRPRIRSASYAFWPHGFSPHPAAPHRAAFQKAARGGHVDLVEKRFLGPIAPKPGHHFYGHGVHSADGEVIFAVESRLDDSVGVITVRDGKTFAIVDEFPSFGDRPHDCMLVDGGGVLAITNGGGPRSSTRPGSVTFVSVADRRLLDKREIVTQKLNAGHFAITDAGALAVVSAPREGLAETEVGGVSLSGDAGKLAYMAEPQALASRMVGEALSVCIDEVSGHVVVTHPHAHLVSIWHLGRRALVKHLELESPRGVVRTADGKYFVISFGARAALLLLDAETLERPGSAGARPPRFPIYLWRSAWLRLTPYIAVARRRAAHGLGRDRFSGSMTRVSQGTGRGAAVREHVATFFLLGPSNSARAAGDACSSPGGRAGYASLFYEARTARGAT